MATTLWPIIHRLSTLAPIKAELEPARRAGHTAASKAAVLRTELQTGADAIESALLQGVPSLPPRCRLDQDDCTKVIITSTDTTDTTTTTTTASKGQQGEDEKGADEKSHRIHSILNNALAYRHSALVYLYRTVAGHARSHPLVQAHTRRALAHCAATVSHAGTMDDLLWPLFVAACEAVDETDRGLAHNTNTTKKHHQNKTNIGRAWDIVQE